MKKSAYIFCMTIVFYMGYALFIFGAYSAERMTSEQGQFSFIAPTGYIPNIDETSGDVTLSDGETLARFIPKITVEVLAADQAMNGYDEIEDELQRDRYALHPKMRLLNNNSLRTTQGINGWELSYLTRKSTLSIKNMRIIVCRYLLLATEEKMVQIICMAPYDTRNEFNMICDQFVNNLQLQIESEQKTLSTQ